MISNHCEIWVKDKNILSFCLFKNRWTVLLFYKYIHVYIYIFSKFMWHYRFISNSTNIYLSASLTFSWICMNSVNFVCQNWLNFTMKLVFRQMKHEHILFLFFFSPNCKSKSIFIDILISNIEVTCYVNTPSVEFSYVRISSKWHSALPLPFDVVRPTSGHCILCIVVMCHIHFVIFLNC